MGYYKTLGHYNNLNKYIKVVIMSDQSTNFFVNGTIFLKRPYMYFNLNGYVSLIQFDTMSLHTPIDNTFLDENHNELEGSQKTEFSITSSMLHNYRICYFYWKNYPVQKFMITSRCYKYYIEYGFDNHKISEIEISNDNNRNKVQYFIFRNK